MPSPRSWPAWATTTIWRRAAIGGRRSPTRSAPATLRTVQASTTTLASTAPPADVGEHRRTALRAIERGIRHGKFDSGYAKQQRTRPQTLGYGLTDSPVGQAAWILEKFWSWTDHPGDPLGVLDRDDLLDNVMIYWVTATATSSARPVLGELRQGRPANVSTSPPGSRCTRKRSCRRYASGSSTTSRTSATGTSNHEAGTSPRWRSPTCSLPTCGAFAAALR